MLIEIFFENLDFTFQKIVDFVSVEGIKGFSLVRVFRGKKAPISLFQVMCQITRINSFIVVKHLYHVKGRIVPCQGHHLSFLYILRGEYCALGHNIESVEIVSLGVVVKAWVYLLQIQR